MQELLVNALMGFAFMGVDRTAFNQRLTDVADGRNVSTEEIAGDVTITFMKTADGAVGVEETSFVFPFMRKQVNLIRETHTLCAVAPVTHE